MQKEVVFKSQSRNPSEYSCSDGELRSATNVVQSVGGLTPLLTPKYEFSLLNSERLMCIHKTADISNYIVYDGAKVYAKMDGSENDIIDIGDLISVKPIGNTLVLLSKTRLDYVLYKDGVYIQLGQRPPVTDISFSLTKVYEGKEVERGSDDDVFNKSRGFFTNLAYNEDERKDYISELTGTVMAGINTFIADAKKEKLFTQPFLIRYAYRMYDGSHIMHSTPVLMTPTNGINPVIYSKDESKLGVLLGIKSALKYDLVTNATNLMSWKDIIIGIDFFVSSPKYTIDSSGDVVYSTRYQDDRCTSVGGYSRISEDGQFNTFSNSLYISHFDRIANSSIRTDPTDIANIYKYNLPIFSDDKLNDNIKNEASFYKIASIERIDIKSTDQFTTDYSTVPPTISVPIGTTVLKIDDDVLTVLETQETLDDDYISKRSMGASIGYVYNNRINLSGVTLFSPEIDTLITTHDNLLDLVNVVVCVYITKPTGEMIVKKSGKMASTLPKYFFYPDYDAYRMEIYYTDSMKKVVLPLSKHVSLNGAVYFKGFNTIPIESSYDIIPDAHNEGVLYSNKIYTSTVDNPFQFKATDINSVGSGTILSIASSTKALSEGQFGQFPLYAFTDQGVWALSISNTGGYSAVQPVTRDVVNNPKSITQIDGAVAFTTEQGVMILIGNSAKNISSLMDSEREDPRIDLLDGCFNVLSLGNHATFGKVRFKTYLKNCLIAYDYPNSLLVVSNVDYKYSYVYSFPTQSWSMYEEKYKDVVNNYPDSFMITDTNGVYNISNRISEVKPISIVTRAFKLGEYDIRKTVTRVILRGDYDSDDIKLALFGALEPNGEYVLISSSSLGGKLVAIRGSSYKYFVVGIFGRLNVGAKLTDLSVVFENKLINKVR